MYFIKKIILSLMICLAVTEDKIKASQDHALNASIQAWLNECHRANLKASSPSSLQTNTQDQKLCLTEGASPALSFGLSKGGVRFSVSSSSSSDSLSEMDDQRGVQVDRNYNSTEFDNTGYFVVFIRNPAAWKELLKNVAWQDDQILCTKEHYRILDQTYRKYLGKHLYKNSARSGSESQSSDTTENRINEIIGHGQTLLQYFRNKLGSL
jgi:hypothetical protein